MVLDTLLSNLILAASYLQVAICNAMVTPLRKAASYEQRKTNLGSSP